MLTMNPESKPDAGELIAEWNPIVIVEKRSPALIKKSRAVNSRAIPKILGNRILLKRLALHVGGITAVLVCTMVGWMTLHEAMWFLAGSMLMSCLMANETRKKNGS